MSFIPKTAADHYFALRFYSKTASTAFALNSLVAFTTAGSTSFIAASSTTTHNIGAILKAVVSTDSDYASTTFEPILIPTNGWNSVWIATTASGASTNNGKSLDLSDASTVNSGATSVGAFLQTGYRSATQIEGILLQPTSTT